MRTRVLLLATATIVCLSPWLGKPFVVDDPLFLQAAQQILQAPGDFYGGVVNWYGRREPLVYVINNPPLQSGYLALVAKFSGFQEFSLHLAMLLPAVAAILGTAALAARMEASPLLAGFITLVCPAFLLSSTTVMCDVSMLALWVWALVLWMRGIDNHEAISFVAAAFLIGACGLTKYFGLALLPLALVYGIMQRRRPGLWCLWLAIPIVMFAAFEAYTRSHYNRGLISGAGAFALAYPEFGAAGLFNRAFLACVFLGGSLLTMIGFFPWLWSWRGMIAWSVAVLAIGGWLIWDQGNSHLPTRDGGQIDWSIVVQTTLMVVAGLQLFGLAIADLAKTRSSTSVLLLLWVGGTFVFATWVNWAINGRSLLPALPAAGLLIARRLSWRGWNQFSPLQIAARAGAPLALSLLLCQMLCWADYRSAIADRTAAEAFLSRQQSKYSPLWFQGHWGWQFYLERGGAFAIDYTADIVTAGSVMLIPEDATGVTVVDKSWLEQPSETQELVSWLTTNSPAKKASFYSSTLGLLPYRFCEVPPRRYRAFVPIQDINFPAMYGGNFGVGR